MQLINYKWDKPIFHQAAHFTCTGCFYGCEVYSNFEWVEGFIETCRKCGTENIEHFNMPVFLYRWDCYPKLSIDPAYLPDEIAGCKECSHVKERGGKFHWTELDIPCWECEKGRMTFSEFTEGIKMKEFIEIAIEETKLKMPEMGYVYQDTSGSKMYVPDIGFSCREPEERKKIVVRMNPEETKLSAT